MGRRYKKNPPADSDRSAKRPSSVRPEPSSSSKPDQACSLVLCEDPETGELLVKPSGQCPPGYIEKIRDKAIDKGVTFIIPKVRTREE